ncbi:hypothetical protein DPMN_191400 [Dreissena polymorpha]|uniref:Uncharacterized protein n=1 Tax=Dreissena polymorpha TaxID=45954 RepID=A0A9D3Y486_DREPO|nr:hypothetical protein DPMN_191400 [Dreissena polymorpha]
MTDVSLHEKTYITDSPKNMLLTLASDGSVLATFMHPVLEWPIGVHVSPAGQVLVCGEESSTILQIDNMGNRKLVTMATKKDPWSVCYNSNNYSIIVGQNGNNKIMVYKVK